MKDKERPGKETEITENEAVTELEPAPANKFKRLWHWAATHKKLSIPLGLIFVVLILAAIPFTRYGLASNFVKQSYPVIVVDGQTGKPVSGAKVILDNKEATTDNQGRVSIRLGVGPARLEVSKKYYTGSDREVTVPFRKPSQALNIKLEATGRPVPVTVVNKITKKPVTNITLAAEGTEVKTDKDGKAIIVLPADKKEVLVKLSGSGFNTYESTLAVTSNEVPENTFSITPTGKLYFLSNQSGNIDVVKTNLDGTDRQTVLAGTGTEDEYNTVLLASRDWKYLALHAKRGSEKSKLYLIDTSNDSLTVMDEGNATFDLTGWSGHYFVYRVNREDVQAGQSKKYALKSYNAESKKIAVLDETQVETEPYYTYTLSASETFAGVYTFEDEIVYVKNLYLSHSGIGFVPPNLRQASINSVQPDGRDKKTLKSFPPTNNDYKSYSVYISSYPYEPGSVYFSAPDGKVFYEYEDGKVEELKDFTVARFNEAFNTYPTYLLSPSGKENVWNEQRDGKSVIYVGDARGQNGKQVTTLKDFQTYGWYTDDILLLSKDGSELYAMSAAGSKDENDLLKITDYYKPAVTYRGYGGGYGGL